MNEAKRKIEVRCPRCKESFWYYESEFRPFCSKRCKMIDLGHWLSESYAVPAQNPIEEHMDGEGFDDEYDRHSED